MDYDRKNKIIASNGNVNEEKEAFEKRVLQIDRVARTVAGGKRIRFRALVIVGNHAGQVGIGIAKASEVADAVNKAVKIAEKNLINVKIRNSTISHRIEIQQGSAHLILKPARPGTSIIAGGTIRAIAELAGINNIVGKILGTANKINNAKAMIEALKIISKDNETSSIAKN